MTPGITGGMRNVVVVKAPKAAILHLSCFAPSGLLVNLHSQTPGFTRGHTCIAPSELDFPINRPLSLNS
jgi:hypothetical protein